MITSFYVYELARQRQQELLNEAARAHLAGQTPSWAPHGPSVAATILSRVRTLTGALRSAHTRHLDRRLQPGRPSFGGLPDVQ